MIEMENVKNGATLLRRDGKTCVLKGRNTFEFSKDSHPYMTSMGYSIDSRGFKYRYDVENEGDIIEVIDKRLLKNTSTEEELEILNMIL